MSGESQREIVWAPNPGPQTKFLASTASEVLYGGAAGGGKSAASIALPLRWVSNGNFRCLFLRREAVYLKDAIDKSRALYPKLGGRFVQSPRAIWTFPSGAEIWLHHCEHEKDVANYDSLEFHLVVFEELTHFTERQYRHIQGRIRGTDPTLPRYVRATCNPGGDGHEWVFRYFGAWLNPKHPKRAAPGEVRWFVGDDEVQAGTPDSRSRQFIPARLGDNPYIGPEYRAQLMALDPVRRAQLLDGDWLVQPGRGLYFKRGWIPGVDAPPLCLARVRAWDLAATVDGDWTVGLLLGRTGSGQYVILDVVRFRGTPNEVDAMIAATAEQDGPGVPQILPQDPGQAGVSQVAHFTRLLAGKTFRFVRPTGDKVTRAGPVSSQAQAGNLLAVRGEWLPGLIGELEAFPEGSHDDQVDALSDAFNALAAGGNAPRPAPHIETFNLDSAGLGF